MACDSGDKPTIIYSFDGGSERIFKTDLSPIEVTIKNIPVDATGNYNREGFELRFTRENDGSGYLTYAYDYYTFAIPGGSPISTNYIAWWACGQSGFGKRSPCTANYEVYGNCALNIQNYVPGSAVINRAIKCPTAIGNKCSIIISHNGQSIHKDQGACPTIYDVQCKRCPEGTCECKTPIYPGYCCLDCSTTAASIRTITNELKTKNG